MKSKLSLAVLFLCALTFQRLPLQDPPASTNESRARAVAMASKPDVKPGTLVDLIGYSSASDGFHSVVEYLPNSTAVIDNAFVFAPATGAAGRLVATQRELLDLEFAGLENNDDITHLLTSVAENFAGDVFRLRLPRSLTNLYCGKVTFPAGLDMFEVLAGGDCTITQAVNADSSSMWELPHPQNVNIESGVDFVGQVNPDNLEFPSAALISVIGTGKSGIGGHIKCFANFTNTTTRGFGVFGQENLNKAYDTIEIRGNFDNSGINSNHTVKHLIIDATLSDPDGYGNEYTKTRGTQCGRVIETCSINVFNRYGGSGLFLFKMHGAAGNVNVIGHRLGILKDGTMIDTGGAKKGVMKLDTLGQGSFQINVSVTESNPNFAKVTAEATPGPTNNCNFELLHPDGILELGAVNDSDGGINFQNFGNSSLNSVCDMVTSGPAAVVINNTLKRLTCRRHLFQNQLDIASVGFEVIRTTVTEQMLVDPGTHARFFDCSLPGIIVLSGSGEPTMLSFQNCSFPVGTQLKPLDFNDLRVGFSGIVSGLNISNLPVQCLPYLRLDAMSHPRHEAVNQNSNSTILETINRSVDWKTTGRSVPVWHNGTTTGSREIFLRIIDINPETCVGRIVFPQISSTLLLGSYLYDLGVSDGVIEAAITFTPEGAPKAGLMSRAQHDLNAVYAYLDRDADTVNLQIGQPGSEPSLSAPLSIDNGKEHILALQLEGNAIGVYVDGEKKLSLDSALNQTFTQWGVKHLHGIGSNGSGIDAHGPKYRYLEVRPLTGDSTVEKERREL